MLLGKYVEKRIFEFETKLSKDKFSIKKARGLTLAFHVIIKVSCINKNSLSHRNKLPPHVDSRIFCKVFSSKLSVAFPEK